MLGHAVEHRHCRRALAHEIDVMGTLGDDDGDERV